MLGCSISCEALERSSALSSETRDELLVGSGFR
jgi:hypothetical protein